MTTLESVWNAIVPYLTTGTIIGILVTVLLTALKIIKYQKATRIDAIKAIEDKLMSLSVNKDIRLSLETLTTSQLKNIEKSLTDRLDKSLIVYDERINKLLRVTEALAGAVAHLKALPSEQVANINAVLGLVSPATIIELKPIEKLVSVNPIIKEEKTSYNPFAG